VDRFAAAHKNKAPRFNSHCATAEAVDAFAQSLAEGISFMLHHFNNINRLDHIFKKSAEAHNLEKRRMFIRLKKFYFKERILEYGADK
jgi:hypothetical protein